MPFRMPESEAAIARRQAAVAAALQAGYTRSQIVAATGTSNGTISSDVAVAKHNGVVRAPGPPPSEPLVIHWRDEDCGPSRPAKYPLRSPRRPAVPSPAEPADDSVRYRASVVLATIEGEQQYLSSRNGIVLFAYDVKDALAAGDTDWVGEADESLRRLGEYVAQLRRVIADPAVRSDVLDTQYHREDVHIPRPTLRVAD